MELTPSNESYAEKPADNISHVSHSAIDILKVDTKMPNSVWIISLWYYDYDVSTFSSRLISISINFPRNCGMKIESAVK